MIDDTLHEEPSRSGQLLKVLAGVADVLSSSYDTAMTLPRAATLLAENFADRCIIEVGGEGEERVILGAADREAGADSRPATLEPNPGLDGKVSVHTQIVIPLANGGTEIGSLVLANLARPLLLDEYERRVVDLVATRIALAIDNARLARRERLLAHTLQTALLPTQFPQTPGQTYHAAYSPSAKEAEVGGDWYDVFPLPDGATALSIGDVGGHGLDAAVIMGEVRQTFRVAAMQLRDPAAVLNVANHLLLLRQEPVMVTAIFGIYDGKRLTYATAGHPPPLLTTGNGIVERLPTEGLPLGIEPDDRRATWTISIPPGSMVVWYTDGLIEFCRDVKKGETGLANALHDEWSHPSKNPAAAIRDRVLSGYANADDVAILTLSVGDTVVTQLDLEFSAVPIAGTLVRQAFSKLAAGLELSEDKTFSLQVAVGEAVNNVIEHAYMRRPGSFTVRARRENGSIAVCVTDHGRWRPAREENRGRGLPMIRALMKSVEVDLSSTGTSLKFVCDLNDGSRKRRRISRR